MIGGFLGTLIALERAVALQRSGGYAVPLLTALGALVMIAGVPGVIGPLFLTLGSLGLVAIFAIFVSRHIALFTATMGLGALLWFAGNALWLYGRAIPYVVPLWAGFLILTIAGERLELGRIQRLSRGAQAVFIAGVVTLLIGILLSFWTSKFDSGVRLMGLGELVVAVWLFRYDLSRRTVRQKGLTGFIAICLLIGYLWLGVGGSLAMVYGGVVAGPRYDAIWHALFLGFVFSMIFGHAPVILPAVTGVKIPFHRLFYGHLILLHISLVVRVTGDLIFHPGLRRWGGLLNGASILLFLILTAISVITGFRARSALPPRTG
jgi:hypothetical protein